MCYVGFAEKVCSALDSRRQGEAVRQPTDCDAEANEEDDVLQPNKKMQTYLSILQEKLAF